MTNFNSSQRGFTLVELTLAMALFGFLLIIVLGGMLQVLHIYQNGLISRNTQQSSRFGLEEIMRDARQAQSAAVLPGSPGQILCLNRPSGVEKFYLTPVSPPVPAVNVLVKGQLGPGQACTDPATSTETLSPSTVSVVDFQAEIIQADISNAGALGFAPDSVKVTLSVSGDASTSCAPGADQFCSVTTLTSTATLRGSQ